MSCWGGETVDRPAFDLPAGVELKPLILTDPIGGREAMVAGNINHFLREYQRDGVRFLWDRLCRGEGAILADDMGLGKTVQVAAFLAAVYGKKGNAGDRDSNRLIVTGTRKVKPTLIISPSSLLTNWEEELDTWAYFIVKKYFRKERDEVHRCASEGRCEIVLTSFETARDSIELINQVAWQAVVVDECHRIKEQMSRTTIALKSLVCKRRIGLTGTALQNKYEELWCLLDWASPGCLGSLKHFQAEFSGPMTRGFKFDATKLELATARLKQTKLNEAKQTWMLRRTKDRVIADQLPKKTDQVVFCALSPAQHRIFKALTSHPDTHLVLTAWDRCTCGRKKARINCCHRSAVDSQGGSARAALFQLMHVFIKAANHAALLLPDRTKSAGQASLGRQIFETAFEDQPELLQGWTSGRFLEMSDTGLSGKMSVLAAMLAVLEQQNDKVLLFSYSTTLLDILESYVSSQGYTYRRLDGTTRIEIRQSLVREFNTDSAIFLFLLSTRVGGIGLNITGANTVIIFDPNWNPSHDLQAQDRAYRIGQTRDVKIFRLISVGCIEEIIYLRQVYKQQLASSSVDCETARRYFLAVQGDSRRRGELFGVRNLFRVNPLGQCLTADIIRRNQALEETVRGRSKLAIAIQDNMLDESRIAGPDSSQHGGDPFHMLLEEEEEEDDKEEGSGMEQVLAGSGVVHHHANQSVIGASRVEQHISACAAKDVVGGGGSAHLPAAVCDLLQPTQDITTLRVDMEERATAADYVPLTAGNRVRRLAARSGGDGSSTAFVYGATPTQQQRQIFDQIAAAMEITPCQLAKQVVGMDFMELLATIRRHQESRHAPNEALTLLDSALSAHLEEQREQRLRRLSYNQPTSIAPVPIRTRKTKGRRSALSASRLDTNSVGKQSPLGPKITTKNCDKDEFMSSFMADDDAELLSSLGDQPLDVSGDPLSVRAAGPSPCKVARSCAVAEFSASVSDEEDAELLTSLRDTQPEGDQIQPNKRNSSGGPRSARSERVVEKLIPTRPAPAGQTYRMAVQMDHQKKRSDASVGAQAVPTIGDIFDTGLEDDAGLCALLGDQTRPSEGRSRNGRGPGSSRCLDSSDLLDQIFS